MKITIDYGKDGMEIEVPAKNLSHIISMKHQQPLADPVANIEQSLNTPVNSPSLNELTEGKSSVVILVSDITRPVPNSILLPPILNILQENGIEKGNIIILVATGLHRPNMSDELKMLVGEDIYKNYYVTNHYSKKLEELVYLGNTHNGTPVIVNKFYYESQLKIATGFIEPHLMAGYSGGRKSVCPGVCGIETVRHVHSPKILEHPECREGVLNGNPYHEEAEKIMKMAGLDFIVNVSLNEKREITGVFTGEPVEAHKRGSKFVGEQVSSYIPEFVDVVITTNGGYPLDLNLYQCCKGATGALPIVKPGGTVILAAECSEGLGSPEFEELFRNEKDPGTFMDKITNTDFFVVDQWGLEELIKAHNKVNLFLISGGVLEEDKQNSFFMFKENVEQALAECLEQYGDDMSIAVIPRGPYVMPRIRRK